MDLRSMMLVLHVGFGSIALLTSALAFLTEKGPRFHAKVGRVYAMAMVGVGSTAAVLWALGSSSFLLFIAFFSTYLVLVGWRLGHNRRGVIGRVDAALLGMGVVGALGLLAVAVTMALPGQGDEGVAGATAVVPLVFAAICAALAFTQRSAMKQGTAPRGKDRIRQHGLFMGAGTIATVTAFSLTAVGGGVVMWLLPTVIGTPLILWNLRGLRTGRVAAPEVAAAA